MQLDRILGITKNYQESKWTKQLFAFMKVMDT